MVNFSTSWNAFSHISLHRELVIYSIHEGSNASHIKSLSNLVRNEDSIHLSASPRLFFWELLWTIIDSPRQHPHGMCTYLSSFSCQIVFYIFAYLSPLLYYKFLFRKGLVFLYICLGKGEDNRVLLFFW